LLLLGLVVGIAVLYYAVTQRNLDGAGEYKPLGNLAVRKPTEPPVRTPTEPPVRTPTEPPVAQLTKTSSQPPASVFAPEHLKKKLNFVMLAAELTRAGIDARLEDGSSKLVMWRDVVGLVARRLPPEHDGVTFVDVVSTAGCRARRSRARARPGRAPCSRR
jgi:hypothetical protein